MYVKNYRLAWLSIDSVLFKNGLRKYPSPFIFSLGMPINTGDSEKKMKGEGILHIRFQKIENGADKRGTAFYLIIILLHCIVYVACCIAIKSFLFVGPMSMVHHTLVLPF